jgi:hypothetical protein
VPLTNGSFTAQFVRLFVKRMHGRILQKETKETKMNFSEGFFPSAAGRCDSKSYGAFEEFHVLRLPHRPSFSFFHPSFPSVPIRVCVYRLFICVSNQKWVKLQINASSYPSRQKRGMASP